MIQQSKDPAEPESDAFTELVESSRRSNIRADIPAATTRRPISEQVANRFLAMIKSGNLRSGDRLPTEQQMTIAFGISRPPLREALKALTLSDDFIAGVNLLNNFGWHFEINVNHTQMDIVRDFVPQISTPMILDHCGKPGIAEGALDQYRTDVAALSKHKNLWIKLSDLPVEAGKDWTEADLRPYITATLEAFGPERTIFAGDYPICLAATTMTGWVDLLDRAFADLGLSETETRSIYRDNANRFYRLGL